MSTFIESIFSSITNGGSVRNKPLLQQDLIDNLKNWYDDKSFRFVFGKRTGINNTRVDLWEWPTDTYVFPASPITMTIESTSANDTSNGTWVRSVSIDWLDSDYNLHVSDIVLNWTTPVTISTGILRINYLHATAVGSSNFAVGDIKITSVWWGVTYSVIKAGYNTARQAIATIPAWVTGYLSHWQSSSGANSGSHFTGMSVTMTAITWVSYPWVFLVVDETGTLNSWHAITFPIPVRIPEKTDIKMIAVSDASNANVTGLWALMWWFEAM